MNENENKSLSLPAAIVIAAVLISGSIIYLVGALKTGNQPAGGGQPAGGNDPPAKGDISALMKVGGRDVIMGNANAPVTLIEYGDYQCPFCGRFFTLVEPTLRKDYIETGKVRMVYRDFAFLDGVAGGKNESHLSAEAAQCAKDQGKFTAYHDTLFEAEMLDGKENNGNLNAEFLTSLASRTGLNLQNFKSCFDSRKYASDVRAETEAAQNVGINGTPTVLIDGVMLSGVDSSDPTGQYVSAIENALKNK